MPYRIIEGKLIASNRSFAIVAGRFNELISRRLVDGAIDCLVRHDAVEEKITVVWTPGAFEIPLITKKLVKSGQYHAVICTTAVIRGSTPHFEYISAETTKGIAQVALESEIPVTYGIITADTIEQAIERAGTKAGNKGWDAALAAIEMVNLLDEL
ncbi:MAG: 6,7-dimethyl-8-ribityllumazine synthase [Candidatus Cloacimonetes bacterium 4572_55]|nr:MAG: 6,7-dimethyl-8-ribityllumazine synthase [Candidatus Cloacimonetes bacterium 4572_55]